MKDGTPYAERRERVAALLGPDAAMVLAASPELMVGDTELRYVVDPELYWLTGYTEPAAVAVLCPSHPESRFTLFVRPRDRDGELWTGVRGGTEAALEQYGADRAHPVGSLAEQLTGLLEGVEMVHARLGTGRSDVDAALSDVLQWSRARRPRRGVGPRGVIDPGAILDDLRLVKDETEIGCLRAAADLSVDVFREASASIGAGAGEWQIEAAVDGGFRVRGANGPAFPTIVASGANAIVLHHTSNDRVMAAGDMVLVDAGARHAMYCADITRTFPVAGRFKGAQKVLYETVLRAHDAAIDAARPGATIADVHDAALRALLEGLIDLGCATGPVARLMENEDDVTRFYPHRTSHWLGLDVHDAGDYVRDGAPRVLAPGMVLTVEPGLYIGLDALIGPQELRGTGIRIEDDVLITPYGHDVLTSALPVDVAGIEALLD
ncbi:MAG: aminopeptidase P N-terminal domain-containing protein [Longimicrobiales bacterium]